MLVHPGHAQARQGWEVLEAGEALEHLLARAAAAVAPAEGEEALLVAALAAEILPDAEEVEGDDVAVVVRAGVVEHVGRDAAAVYAFPPEKVVGEAVRLAPLELRREEAGDAGP